MQRELAEALLRKFEERPQLQGGLDGVCRLLLTADTYSVPLLRDHCLHRLAARFSDLATRVAPHHEQTLFAQFLQAIAPVVGLQRYDVLLSAQTRHLNCNQELLLNCQAPIVFGLLGRCGEATLDDKTELEKDFSSSA